MAEGRPLLEAIDTAIVITDASARVMFMNRPARRLHRLSDADADYTGEAYGLGFIMLDEQGCPVATESSPVLRAARGLTVSNESYIIRFDGSDDLRVWQYSASGVDAMDQAAAAVVLTLRDITEDVLPGETPGTQGGEASRGGRLQSLLELLPVAAAVCDDQGKIIAANAAIEDVWSGLPRASSFEEYGKCRAWWAEGGAPLLPQDWALYRAVTFGQPIRGELLEVCRSDNTRGTILSSVAPIRNERGTITGAIAVVQDVSESMRKELLDRQVVGAMRDILRTPSLDDRIGIVVSLIDTMLAGSSTAFVVAQGGDLGYAPTDDGLLARFLASHESDIWSALRIRRAVSVSAVDDVQEALVVLVPVRSSESSFGCFVTLVRDRTHLSEPELESAEQLVVLLPVLFDAAADHGGPRPVTEKLFSLDGLLMKLLESESLGFQEAEWIASRLLQLLMEQGEADYGRVVVADVEGLDGDFRVLSEIGFGHDGAAGSMGAAAATATGEPVIVPTAAEVESVPYASYVTLPFAADSGYGCVTLAWLARQDSTEAHAEAAVSGTLFLGLLLSSADLREKLVKARRERIFMSAVAAAIGSCFDAAGLQESVSRVVQQQLGAVGTHLFRLDLKECVRAVAPTFSTAPAAECAWAEIEKALTASSDGVLLVSAHDNPLDRLVRLTEGQQGVVLPLRLRSHPIGLMVTILDRAEGANPRTLELLKEAAREVADALAVAEYCAAQTRIAMRSSVAETMESRVADLDDEDAVAEVIFSTVMDALKAVGIVQLIRGDDGWEITHAAGNVDHADVVGFVEAATVGSSGSTTMLAAHDGAIISTTWLDQRFVALVALRGTEHGPFVREDLELLHRIHSVASHSVRSLRLRQEREAVLVARERWLADISHDLKTPLSVIRGYAELLSDSGDVPPREIKRQAGRIARHASEIERLLDNLQLVCRIRAKALPVEMTTEDANRIASEVVQLVQADSRSMDGEVALEKAAEEVLVEVDRRLLVRALSNLTMNSLVHGGPGVRVEVRVTISDGACRIEIADNGRGIDPAELERVFDRYCRGASACGDSSGSGLGLPIARELVELMHGTLIVDSAPGGGTTAVVELTSSSRQ